MKVLFLDFDGVCNCIPTDKAVRDEMPYAWRYGLNPNLVSNVRRIVKETGCSIVISSSWRLFPDHPLYADWRTEFVKMLGLGYDPIIDYTCDAYKVVKDADGRADLMERKRGTEIRLWLDAHKDVERFVVIDDDTYDIRPVIDNGCVLKTNIASGLTIGIAEAAIRILNR